MRKVLLVFLAIWLATAPFASAQSTIIDDAEAWLLNQQFGGGSFGSVFEDIYSTMALAAIDQPNTTGLTWIENRTIEPNGNFELYYLATTIITVLAHGDDPFVFADGDVWSNFKTELEAWPGIEHGDYCLGIMALGNAGAPIQEAFVDRLLELQNPNGSFSITPSGNDHLVITSHCLHALAIIQANGDADVSAEIASAVAYIEDSQLADGSWEIFIGEDGSGDGIGTAFVLMSLLAVDENALETYSTAVDFLIEQQNFSGGFIDYSNYTDADVVTTALAMMVLEGKSMNSFALTNE